MKKILLITLFVPFINHSQTFTTSNEYVIGTSQTMYQLDSSANKFISNIGTSAVWDYSNLAKFENRTNLFTVIDNDNATDYPSSNKVVNIEGVLKTYLETNANERKIVGLEYNTQNVTYGTIKLNFSADENGKIQLMDYPFSFNTIKSDICEGILSANIIAPTVTNGTSLSVFDGIGELKLANGVNLTNVLRHNLSLQFTAEVNLIGIQILTIDINQFDYYHFSTANLPVFSYVNVKIQFGTTNLGNLNFVLSTQEPANNVSLIENQLNEKLLIFPNPVKDQLSVQHEKFIGNEKISLTTIDGKLISEFYSNQLFNTSELKSGTYFISTEIDGRIIKEKFVKD
jgi:hypothetical protein